MNQVLAVRARMADEFYSLGSTSAGGSASESNGAYLVRLPRSFLPRYVEVHGRVLRILPSSSNEESGTRVIVVLGPKFSWPGESQAPRHFRWARAI